MTSGGLAGAWCWSLTRCWGWTFLVAGWNRRRVGEVQVWLALPQALPPARTCGGRE